MQVTRTIVRTAITPEQREKLEQLSQCRFLPGSWDKRFVRDLNTSLAVCEASGSAMAISLTQAEQIDRLYHRYRRQIKPKR